MTAIDNAILEGPRGLGPTAEVWLITIGHAITHWYPATFYVLLPLIGQELGLSYGQIGLILSVRFAAGAIANLPSGILVDLVSRKGAMLAAALFWVGVPYLVMGYSKAYWLLLICSAALGVGNNLWHPAAIPWLGRRFPSRKGFVIGIHGMGGNIGDAAAPLVTGLLLSAVTWMTWRDVVVINIIPGFAMSVLILWLLGGMQMTDGRKKSGDNSLSQVLRELSQLFGSRTVIVLSISSAFRLMTQNGILVFLPLYLAGDLGYSAWWVGFSLFLLQGAGLIAAPVAGYASDRIGRRRIIMSSMAMTGITIVALYLTGGTPAFVFLVAILGFFLFAIRPVLQAWIIEAVPDGHGGTALGAMFSIQSMGAAVSPFVCGAIADRWGLMATFWWLACSIIIANFLVFLMPSNPAEGRGSTNPDRGTAST